jgi:predicted ATPase
MLVGRFSDSRSHLEEVLALFDPIAHRPLVHQTGSHPRVGSRGHLGIVLFCLGFPDQGTAHSNAGITEAWTLAHPPSVAASLAMGARLLCLGGDNAALDERACQLITVATEQGFPMYSALGAIYHGWAKVTNGELLEGLSLLRSATNAYRSTGAEYTMPYYTALVAKACEIADQVEEASTQLDNALQVAEKSGERWFTAELYRQKGQLLLRQGKPEAAEEFYRGAFAIAEQQAAKLWQLRAAVSLAELGHDRGPNSEARNRLTSIYGSFTEGFDTPDLKSAKGLLDNLS